MIFSMLFVTEFCSMLARGEMELLDENTYLFNLNDQFLNFEEFSNGVQM